MLLKFFAVLTGLALVLPIAACRSSGASGSESSEELTDFRLGASEAGSAERHRSTGFAMEVGADCDGSAMGAPPLEDAACDGMLPEHLVSFLRNLPDSHPFLDASERELIVRSRQSFKAVNGLGRRADVVAVINHYSLFWIRSFEGPDPEVTVYMVYGPDCDDSLPSATGSIERRCRSGSAYSRDFTLYRVRKGGRPEDVTRALAPPPPRLTKEERRRYGVYLQPKSEASDADIKLDVSRLVYVPVLRWVLRPVQEGDYEPPGMPASDPRAFVDYYWGNRNVAHFGFLVWNGRRLELRETLSEELWPCRTSGSVLSICDTGYDSLADRYLSHAAIQRPGGPHDESPSHQ